MAKRVIKIEFKGENYEKVGHLWWGLRTMHRMDLGLHIKEMIASVKRNKFDTLEGLKKQVDATNFEIKVMRDYMTICGVNPNWLKEYKDIDLQDFLYLLS